MFELITNPRDTILEDKIEISTKNAFTLWGIDSSNSSIIRLSRRFRDTEIYEVFLILRCPLGLGSEGHKTVN